MRLKTTLLFILFLVPQQLRAAGPSNVTTQTDKKSGRVTAVVSAAKRTGAVRAVSASSADQVARNSGAVAASDKFIAENREQFGVTSVSAQLHPVSVDVDMLGMTVVRYEQRHLGVPVLGAALVSLVNGDGEVISTRGRFLPSIKVDIIPRVGEALSSLVARRAMEKKFGWKKRLREARKNFGKTCAGKNKKPKKRAACVTREVRDFKKLSGFFVTRAPAFFLYNPNFAANLDGGETIPVWMLVVANIYGEEEQMMVDGRNGKILNSRAPRIHADSGTEQDRIYDCSRGCGCVINFFSVTYNYTFGRGGPTAPVRGPNPVPGFNGSTNVDDLYVEMDSLRNFYIDSLGRYAANNQGGMGSGTSTALNESRVYSLFDGCSGTTCANGAAWVSLDPQAFATCRDSMSHDIAAHEYFHLFAYTEVLDGSPPGTILFAAGQPGAVNEAFADVFGEHYDIYKRGEAARDWMGATGSNIKEKRNMADPANSVGPDGSPKAYPDNFNSPIYNCETSDSGGVHHNSTAISKALYLAAEGGEHNECSITGIGLDRVVHVMARAVTNYFIATETVNMAYDALIDSCEDYAGSPGALLTMVPPVTILPEHCVELAKALQSTELDLPGGCVSEMLPSVPANNDYPASCAVPPPVPGDFDGDRDVDLWDWNVLRASWGQMGEDLPADADGSGTVDGPDYDIFFAAYVPPVGTIPPPRPTMPGDYDFDGDVDGGDFLVWQRGYGDKGPGLLPDGNVNEDVDAADYTVWRNNYGNSVGGATDGTFEPLP